MVSFFGERMLNKIHHYISRIKDGKLKEMRAQFGWVYGYARPHFWIIVLYTLLGLSGTVVGLVSSLVSRDLVDIITGHKTGELLFTFVSMFLVTVGSTLIGQISSFISTKITLTVENYIKSDVFDQIMSTEWESLTKYHSGDLMVRWSSDVATVSSGILTLIPNGIIYTFQFFSALYMVVKYDASFAIFALAGIPLSMLISRESMRRMRKNNMSTLAITSKVSSFNQEAFGNVQVLKAFDLLPMYSRRLRELQKEYINVRLKYQKMAIVNAILLTILSMLVTYSAQGWGIYKVWSGAITYGTMTMFLTLSGSLTGTVNNLITLFPTSISLSTAASRLMDLTSLDKEDFSSRDEVKAFYEAHRDEGIGMHVRGITYAYRDSELDIFEDADVDAFPREVVAFVGPSGEGKTTMLRYLLALIQGRSGHGYICAGNTLPEDKNCMDLTASVRQLMAYVPQGNTMFSGTIAENMRNVKEDASDDEIIDALKMACAWDFVERLPDGINSEIKERGGGFSEGQAQRLSIARALLRKSPILLLDEATSALDIQTERQLLKNIMQDSYARTCIVTTHRPTVLNICNRVYSIRDKKCIVLSEDEIKKMITDF